MKTITFNRCKDCPYFSREHLNMGNSPHHVCHHPKLQHRTIINDGFYDDPIIDSYPDFCPLNKDTNYESNYDH